MQLKEYVPNDILTSNIFQKLYDVQQNELDSLNNAIKDIINQCFIDTATWGLDSWERFCGLPIGFENYEVRRQKVKSIIRGYGTVTKSMLKNLLKSMPYGDADITEDVANSTFKIIFNNYYRIPENISEILKTVDIVKPAHLTYSYTFAYNWWGYSVIQSKTWSDVATLTWADLRSYMEV